MPEGRVFKVGRGKAADRNVKKKKNMFGEGY